MNKKMKKITKIVLTILSIIIIGFFAYSITPKTFQNDTYYTIKIGEYIVNNTKDISTLLPWNEGLYSIDPFTWHEGLMYTYPHWLYDVATYLIYNISGFEGIYYATCILSIILGITIYGVNKKLNKNSVISFGITIASLYCLKSFITARAQLVTFILFVLTIFGIEQFLKTKKIRYAIMLIVIPIIIANVHSAVWPFYFVLYLPYIAEYLIFCIATANYSILFKKVKLFFTKKKMDKNQLNEEYKKIKEQRNLDDKRVRKNLSKLYKLRLKCEKNAKWLILIAVICAFTGLLTPIKDSPYTYTLKISQGNTTANISEHLPLTLINNDNMVVILVIVFGILTFTRAKIHLRDFFMLFGLMLLSFMSQRQVSMFVLLGNFTLARLICELIIMFKRKINYKKRDWQSYYISISAFTIICMITLGLSLKYYKAKVHDSFVDVSSYPIAASNYIVNELIPSVGKENLKLYNEYNYGSYLLFRGIPVFIDSRSDLYTPEFNGEKGEDGEYDGRDIFTDFLNISSLASDYEYEFSSYGVTHVITYSNSKLNAQLEKDSNYNELYSDNYFTIYERLSAKISEE